MTEKSNFFHEGRTTLIDLIRYFKKVKVQSMCKKPYLLHVEAQDNLLPISIFEKI